jgi:hypothetical protein
MRLHPIIVFVFALHALAWDVEPDGSQAPLQLGKSGKPQIPAQGTPVFSTRPSPFVFTAETRGKRSQVTLWHIGMGRVAGPSACEAANWSLMRLSPDGQALVGWSTVRGKYRTTIWDSKTGKQLWQGSRDYGVQPWRDFADTDSVIEVDSDLRVWNYRSGTLTHEIELPRGVARGGIVSPGGRYVVLGGHDQILRIVDLRSSQIVEELRLPSFPGIVKTRVLAMAFADDGSELALLLSTSNGKGRAEDTAAILSWSMMTGELRSSQQIDRDSIAKLTASGHEPGIVCLPKFDGWLLWNAGLVDRESGKLVWLLPAPPHLRRFAAPSWALRDGRIIGHLKGGNATQNLFAVYNLPGDIDARVRDARSGKSIDLAGDLPKRDFAGTDWPRAHARLSALKVMPAQDKAPLPEDVLQTVLQDLQSTDLTQKEAALEMLGRAQPMKDQAPRVLPPLREVSGKRESGFITIAGFWIISQWEAGPMPAPPATEEALRGHVADLASPDFNKVVAAFQALGKLDTEAAAVVTGEHYAVNRGLARMTLVKMTHARAGIRTMLTHEEWSVRVDAVRLLAEHGAPDDIPALEALRSDPSRIVQMQVPKAIERLQQGVTK